VDYPEIRGAVTRSAKSPDQFQVDSLRASG